MIRQLLWEVPKKTILQSTTREEERGGTYMMAAKVRGRGPLGGGGGSNRHRIVGGAWPNDPLLTASKEEETVAMACHRPWHYGRKHILLNVANC